MRIQILTSLAQDCNFVEDWLHLGNRNKFHCTRFAQSLYSLQILVAAIFDLFSLLYKVSGIYLVYRVTHCVFDRSETFPIAIGSVAIYQAISLAVRFSPY